jgi:Leucine-rich repeat (LRR) protein
MPEALFLDGRGMTKLPQSLRADAALRHLDVRSNRLRTLPAWLAELPALESLAIGDNPLAGTIPPAVTALTRLRELYVHELELETVPDALGDLGELRTLDLGHNRLTGLPATIGRLTSLETLYLGATDNRLSAIPGWIGELRELQELRLYRNSLTALPPAVDRLTKLRELHLRDNRIAAMPDAIRAAARSRAPARARLRRPRLAPLPRRRADRRGRLPVVGVAGFEPANLCVPNAAL